jgi:proton-coupled amino acid transporter
MSSQLGFCVVYQIFLGDSIHGLIPRLPKIACLLLPLPILIAVCQIRRLKWLAATSFVALFVFCLGFVISLFFSIHRPEFGHVPLNMGPQTAGGFATLISFAVFSFEGIGLVLPLENSIRPEIGPIFTRLFSATVGIVTLTYTFVGALGYVAWGKDVGSSLLDNVIATQGRSGWVVLVIVGFLIGGFCSYPLNMYPVTVRLESLFALADANGNNIASVPYVTWKRAALRTGLVLSALVLAIAIPSFGLFIALIGSLFSTSLAFVFPTLFHMKLFSWPSHWPSGPLNLGKSRLRDLSSSDAESASSTSTSHSNGMSSSFFATIWSFAYVTFDIVVCLFGIVATIVCTIVSAQNIIAAVQSGKITWSFQSKPILNS